MLLRLILIAILFLLSAPVFADTKSELAAIDRQRDDCTGKNGDTVGINECNSIAESAADKVLNRVYRRYVDRLKKTPPKPERDFDKETLKRLVASERAWIVYRDTQCSLEGTYGIGGTLESNIMSNCSYEMTRDRAKRLDELSTEE